MEEDALNFFSERFNALLALSTPGVRPPTPSSYPLDNIHKCRSLLPQDHPLYLDLTPAESHRQISQADRERAKERTSYVQHLRDRARNKTKVLDLIVGQFQEGPLSLLHGWYSQRSSVRVVTRHSRGIRGVAIGTLVAFDKHTNLVLKDVEEQYTVLIPIVKDGDRRGRRQERRQRRLKQVLICGSSVVLVSQFTTTEGSRLNG